MSTRDVWVLVRVARGVELLLEGDYHAEADRRRRGRDAHCVCDVAGTVGIARVGGALGAGEHHRLVGSNHEIGQIRALLHCIGAVRDDDAGRSRIGKVAPHALGQVEGQRQVDGERTDIAELVDHEIDAVQRIAEALTEAVAVNARRGVASLRIVPRRNGAPGGDQDDSVHARRPA